MSKIHYFQRYSSVENTVTNNTLQLFARIYDYSTARASKMLSEITGDDIQIGVEINQQEQKGNSVPDGAILQRSFKILIESKVGSEVNESQLMRHSDSFTNESQKILLLLTKQKISQTHSEKISDEIAQNYPSVSFVNITYEMICKIIQELFADYESEMQRLVEDYVDYCNDVNLFDQSKHLLRIVPCGQSLKINEKHGIYFQPSDRGYTKHSFTGIYKDKRVQCLWKIDSVFDVNFDGESLQKSLIQGRDTDEYDNKIIEIIEDAKTECGYHIQKNHRFFCGTPVETSYKKISSGGIQGARFVNLKNVIGEYLDPQIIAEKLSQETWK